MYLVFYKTTDVFLAEEKLQHSHIPVQIVPTPVLDKAYCGVCLSIYNDDIERVKKSLTNMEYQTV